jgi:transposase
MLLPAKSPDFNPIEHLWAYLKTKLAENNPSTIQELLIRLWEEIPPDVTRKLVDSRRIEAVLRAKGGNTKY